ncbi:hypothetical protein BJ138DRAFT_1067566 [Hygrophoropsis aurantiaca]|uniref:Uncharacterized protein n=1 Tax=Hygrophoropsis aurantiaca TaxID=72124 RepID=A0ACB8A7S3_9AGAM|nr:hypothetical protein BJ138DRAFT_1067566 [Hygrophoropsis aurantiaca]
MPRRSPPSALRLVQGPLPPRNQPKHMLPTVPIPAFHRDDQLLRGPSPPPRTRRPGHTHMISAELPPLDLSSICKSSVSSEPSPSSSPVSTSSGKRIRGPWDHSSSISLEVDVNSMLALPKPAAVAI